MNEFRFNDYIFPLGKKTYLMGILNVTPDSFSDGGKFFSINEAIKHTENMLSEGADIIDIGAVSTRPFASRVSDEEEWERLSPVLEEIKKRFDVPVSVDTFSPVTAKKCIESGADIINDVSGVFSEKMAKVISESGVGWIVMHSGVLVRKTEEETDYPDGIIESVNSFFADILENISSFNIPLNRICLDAGFGFAKNTEQNIELLRNYEKINKHSLALLCALSKKRFVGDLSGEAQASQRLVGTLTADIAAVAKGADILRVHEVGIHKKSISAADRIFR